MKSNQLIQKLIHHSIQKPTFCLQQRQAVFMHTDVMATWCSKSIVNTSEYISLPTFHCSPQLLPTAEKKRKYKRSSMWLNRSSQHKILNAIKNNQIKWHSAPADKLLRSSKEAYEWWNTLYFTHHKFTGIILVTKSTSVRTHDSA